MIAAAFKRAHRRSQALLESLAGASDHKVLWVACVSTALLLHVTFFVSIAEISVPKDNEIISTKNNEITLEFDVLSAEAAGMAASSLPEDNVSDEKLAARSVESPTITSSEDKYFIEARSKTSGSTSQPESLALSSARDTPSQERFHFEDANALAQAAADRAISEARAQNAKQAEQRIRKTWEKQLVVHLTRYRSYPTITADQNAQVTLSFVLDQSGHVVSATVAKSSGEAAIDQAALTMMQRADPVPAPPASVAAKGLNFSLPIVFTLNTGKRKMLRKVE
ncbi:energy transducer TonB [Methylobacterium sp. E-041]|uniref:energy transducer TonB family protein n=1 Tax=Methylobacterium sp. E-041 TaxID=2836573 RepID=UPI001FB9473B|nr:energy transducer TonB [Methylobacterium sp. E-041]MCJ2108530.1 energy transducer TonB [Methylobacterium sp. E-041]